MNYRQQKKEMLYARTAFYVCLCLTVFVGYKGLCASQSAGLHTTADMTGVGSGQTALPVGSDPNLVSQLTQLIQAAPKSEDSSNAPASQNQSPDTSYPGLVQDTKSTNTDSSTDQTSSTPAATTTQPGATSQAPSIQNTPSDSQLMAYLIQALPQNITMLKSLLRAETELTQGDPTVAGPVDQTLAHPMEKTNDPQPSDRAIDQIVSIISHSQGGNQIGLPGAGSNPGMGGGFGNSGLGGFTQNPQIGGSGQNPIAQMGMGLANTPMVLAIICFALGLAAPRLFKRQDPAVIFRPSVTRTPPSIFNSGWQGYGQRTPPDVVQQAGFTQYRPYFVGQELEVLPGQPKPAPMTYEKVRQMSQNLAQKSNRMVRRFLEL